MSSFRFSAVAPQRYNAMCPFRRAEVWQENDLIALVSPSSSANTTSDPPCWITLTHLASLPGGKAALEAVVASRAPAQRKKALEQVRAATAAAAARELGYGSFTEEQG
eukprot:CAMPEP_0175848818 /NCGR_PEP_ID=MMETSP0107_2-20121207/24147_1 /TAXON_ID=195067 ORGANISM="Goniomonas pacifica, Strain CCMP1869" /NCGR_SAMPLE_ID=MMETSP0107_2 /ASSEMBLY_ACC=CAM_ASM_000203 /LENGTH=107 /DNA_ID=CAMNT_0017163841 /DNA_START=500 /DNA_END=824 /DNA_ORIENTATION=-